MKQWEKDVKNDPNFNEFYTTRRQCELIFDDLIPIITEQTGKNIKVCCPCDGEQSEIPKYLKNRTNWEVDYFGDLDVNSEDARARMLKADVVITNPPFSMKVWKPFVTWLIENKKNFFIFGPLLQCGCRKLLKLVTENGMLYYVTGNKDLVMFNRPDGTQKPAIAVFYTSYKVPTTSYSYKPAKEDQYYEGIPLYNRTVNIPPNYMGWMYVPITSLVYLQPFEVDETNRGVPGKYNRVLLRRKAI